jgi:hypothetical protein
MKESPIVKDVPLAVFVDISRELKRLSAEVDLLRTLFYAHINPTRRPTPPPRAPYRNRREQA